MAKRTCPVCKIELDIPEYALHLQEEQVKLLLEINGNINRIKETTDLTYEFMQEDDAATMAINAPENESTDVLNMVAKAASSIESEEELDTLLSGEIPQETIVEYVKKLPPDEKSEFDRLLQKLTSKD
jgi:hypothetical protein